MNKTFTARALTTTLAVTLLFVTIDPSSAQSRKPPKSAAYTIVPFMPPGSASISSYVGDLNEMGEAVGGVELADGSRQAIHLDVDAAIYKSLIGGADTGAEGVNNLNHIVGHDGDRGAFWKSPSAAPVELPPLPGDVYSGATRINDDGFVIGSSDDNDFLSPAISVVWRVTVDAAGVVHVDGPRPLGPLPGGSNWWGYGINEAVNGVAQVAGYSSSPKEAVIWTISLNPDDTLALPGAPIPVGTLGLSTPSWSEAAGINYFGQICGRSDKRPFVDLGEGPQPLSVPRDTQDGYAFEINDASEIVGTLDIRKTKGGTIGPARWHAYLWRDGQMIDLEKQIGSNSGWDKLEWATNINNAGVISGFGRFDVNHRGFLLIPNEP